VKPIKNVQTVGFLALDESQYQGNIAAAEFFKSIPPENRYSEENMEKANEIALRVRDEYRAKMKGQELKMDNTALDVAQGTEPQPKQVVAPDQEKKLVLNRFLRCMTRVAANKVDDPSFDEVDYAEILALISIREDGLQPDINEWVTRVNNFFTPPTPEKKAEEPKVDPPKKE